GALLYRPGSGSCPPGRKNPWGTRVCARRGSVLECGADAAFFAPARKESGVRAALQNGPGKGPGAHRFVTGRKKSGQPCPEPSPDPDTQEGAVPACRLRPADHGEPELAFPSGKGYHLPHRFRACVVVILRVSSRNSTGMRRTTATALRLRT